MHDDIELIKELVRDCNEANAAIKRLEGALNYYESEHPVVPPAYRVKDNASN
jgi:hypothetical protein